MQRKGNGHGKGAVRLEARIGFQQSREASKQKSRTGEKDYGERGLGDYKCTAHAPARVAVCRSAKRLFKPFVRVRTRSLQGRPQPEENSGEKREAERNDEHDAIDSYLLQSRKRGWRNLKQQTFAQEAKREPRGASENRKQQALRQHLLDKAPARRPKGRPDCHFSLSSRCACKHQIGDVGAGNQ